jgi:HAD superfamily hydrolase (TIGR01509 family)
MQAIIFDFDGVIADSYHTALKAFRQTVGDDLSEEELQAGFGGGVRRVIEIWAENRNKTLSEEEIQSLIRQKVENQSHLVGEMPLLPGVKELLDYLKGNYRIAVCSSNKGDTVKAALEHHSLLDYFELIIHSDNSDGVKLKPAPDIYLLTAKRLGLQAKDCVVIEDSPMGIEAGKRANMSVIGVETGPFQKSVIEAKNPDLILRDLSELERIRVFLS